MNPSPEHEPRSTIRMDARLDAMTRQKVDDLAKRFRQPRAAVLSHIMQWGLRRGETLDQGESQGPVRHLSLYVPSELHEHVQQAATTAGAKGAQWLRYMVRQITITDFPTSWQEAAPRERSRDSRTYATRFMLRFGHLTREKLQDLSTHFNTPAAEIIRHLIAQAEPEDFPKSWQMRAAEHRAQQARRDGIPTDQEPRP